MRLPLLILLLCCLAACADSPEPLRIGSNRWVGYAPVYLADDIGWLAAQRIELIEYPHTTGVLRAFNNGLLDAALLTLDEALRLAADGHDLEILLVADVSAGADALYALPAIDSLAALAGQRIGVENTATGGYFLARILELAGLAPRDVQVVGLPVSEHAAALRNGQVDALISFASNEAALHSAGARRLFDSRALPGAIIDVLVVDRQKVGHARRRELRGLWFEAMRQWQAAPQQAEARIGRRLGMSAEQLQHGLAGIEAGDAALDQRMFAQGQLRRELATLQQFLLAKGLLEHPPARPLLPVACQEASC